MGTLGDKECNFRVSLLQLPLYQTRIQAKHTSKSGFFHLFVTPYYFLVHCGIQKENSHHPVMSFITTVDYQISCFRVHETD